MIKKFSQFSIPLLFSKFKTIDVRYIDHYTVNPCAKRFSRYTYTFNCRNLGLFCYCASFKSLDYFHVCALIKKQRERKIEIQGEREREKGKHRSSKNAKSIRGFVTFQSPDSFQSFQRNRSSARLFRVLNSTV